MIRRDEALRALRRKVTGHEFEFATVLEVTDGGPAGFLLRVRAGQRLHPHTLILAANEESLTLDHSIGDPLETEDAEMWADGVVVWLIEQLDTGVLRWGPRVRLDDGTVAIDPSLENGSPHQPWYVSDVPLDRPARDEQPRLSWLLWSMLRARRRSFVVIGDGRVPLEPDPSPGGHLREAGFDVGPGRTAHADGRLIQWLQLFRNDRRASSPLGQLVVSWHDEPEGVAQLEYLECEPLAPRAAVEDLVLAGVHAAADAGARWIEHRFDAVDHLDLGLRWQPAGGVMRLNAADTP